MSGGVRVVGEARLRATLKAAAAKLAGPGMGEATDQATAAMLAAVRSQTPRRSGRLVASVRPGRGGSTLTAAVQAGTPYAGPVEYGTGRREGLRGPHNIRPARMLRDGLTAAAPRCVAACALGVQKSLRGIKGA